MTPGSCLINNSSTEIPDNYIYREIESYPVEFMVARIN